VTMRQIILMRGIFWISIASSALALSGPGLWGMFTVLIVVIGGDIPRLRRGIEPLGGRPKGPTLGGAVAIGFYLLLIAWWWINQHDKSGTWPWLVLAIVGSAVYILLTYKRPWRWKDTAVKSAK
jgi:hypothetical protein